MKKTVVRDLWRIYLNFTHVDENSQIACQLLRFGTCEETQFSSAEVSVELHRFVVNERDSSRWLLNFSPDSEFEGRIRNVDFWVAQSVEGNRRVEEEDWGVSG
jgi:hypothetical protein